MQISSEQLPKASPPEVPPGQEVAAKVRPPRAGRAPACGIAPSSRRRTGGTRLARALLAAAVEALHGRADVGHSCVMIDG